MYVCVTFIWISEFDDSGIVCTYVHNAYPWSWGPVPKLCAIRTECMHTVCEWQATWGLVHKSSCPVQLLPSGYSSCLCRLETFVRYCVYLRTCYVCV